MSLHQARLPGKLLQAGEVLYQVNSQGLVVRKGGRQGRSPGTKPSCSSILAPASGRHGRHAKKQNNHMNLTHLEYLGIMLTITSALL